MSKRPKAIEVPVASVHAVVDTLSAIHGSWDTELTYEDPFQLLVAVILSAQCTDARVNLTTPALFATYPNAQRLAASKQADVEELIHSCGFYRQKAKAIRSAAKDVTERFGGQVPRTMEELVSLAGVGRKTASVVMNQAFDLPAIAVDTHVKRVSHRLGWTRNTDPVKVESDLKALVPEALWSRINGLLILHGRRLCLARKPRCGQCPIMRHCDFGRAAQVNEAKKKTKTRSKASSAPARS